MKNISRRENRDNKKNRGRKKAENSTEPIQLKTLSYVVRYVEEYFPQLV